MKKVFKTLSAVLLATACLTPGLAWAADAPSVTLEQDGALKASGATGIHSALVEMTFVGADADKVTDVALKDAPGNALGSAFYSAADKKATIAVSAGDSALDLNDAVLGMVDVIAQGASSETPVSIEAKLTSFEFIDSDDSSAATKDGTVDSDAVVRLVSTESTTPPVVDDPTAGGNSGNNGNGNNGSGSTGGTGSLGGGVNGTGGNGSGDTSGSGSGSGTGSGNGSASNGSGGTTSTADLKANGVVSSTQTGQSTANNAANSGLVKTGDIALICGIAIAGAAVCVLVGMRLTRRKADAETK